MALSASFTADFSSFTQACVRAELSLKSFEGNANKVEQSLNRMGDSFSGVKVVQQATLMASAVAKLGGEAGLAGGFLKLTDDELKRVAVSAGAAAEKLERLGQSQASAEFKRIATEAQAAIKGVSGIAAPTENLLGSVTKLAGAFGLAFTGAAVVSGLKNLVGNVLDTASAIHDQSAALGFSTDAFQRNTFAAEQSGGSLESFTKAANKLNDNLAGGSDSTVAALTKAGLKFAEIRQMKPEEAWAKVTDAVGQIPDPMTRASVAMDLFGKGALDLLPGMIEGMDKLGQAATIMSNDTINRLEAAQDAWDKFGKDVIIRTGEMIGQMGNLNDQMNIMTLTQKAWLAVLLATDPSMEKASKYLAQLAIDHHSVATAAAVVNDALTKTHGALDKFDVRVVDHTKTLDKAKTGTDVYAKSVQALADVYTGKHLADEVKKMSDAVTKAGGAEKITTSEGEKLVKQLRDFEAQGGRLPPVLQAVVTRFENWHTAGLKVQDGLGSILKLLPNVTKAVEDDAAAWLKAEAGWAKAFGSVSGLTPELKKVFDGASATTKVPLEKWGKDSAVATTDLTQSIDLLAGAFVQMAQVSGDSFGGVARDIAQIISLLDTASKMTHQIGGSKENLARAKPQEIGGNFGAGSVMFSADASNAQKAAAGIQAATAVYSGALEVWSSTSQAAGKATNTLHGAVSGAKAGAAFGPYGVIIGAAAGAIIGFVRSLNDGRQAVQEFAKTQGGFDALHDKLLLLGDAGEAMWKKLTQQTGKGDLGAAKKEIDEITKALADPKIKADLLFLAISKGGAEGAAATAQIGPLLSQLGADASKAGGLWDASFTKMIARAKELGVGLDDVNRLVAGQQDKLVSGAVGVTKAIGVQADAYAGLKKALKDAQDSGNQEATIKAQTALSAAVVTTQGEFDRLSRIELGAFNTLVASGVSSVDAMGQVGAGIDNLIKNADAFGLSGNAAFEELKRWRELTTDNEALLGQIGSLNELLVASANLGSLTADGFADLEAQGVSAFDQLTAAGLTSQEAEMAMKPLLESIIKLHQDKGFAIDEATQKIIDQAKADGILGEQEASTQTTLREGLGVIIELLGGQLPKAWQDMADAAKHAADEATGKDGLGKVASGIDVTKDKIDDGSEEWKVWKREAVKAADEAAKAAMDAAGKIGKVFGDLDINIPVNFDVNMPDLPSFAGQDTSGTPVFPQATGGDYMVTKPTLFLAGEKGPERATFSGAGNTQSKGGVNVSIAMDMSNSHFPDRDSMTDFARKLVPALASEIERLGISR